MDRKSSWRTRTYYRISIAAMLCLTALALGAVNFLDITAAADSTPVQEAKGVAEGKASPAAIAALNSYDVQLGQTKDHFSQSLQLRFYEPRWHGSNDNKWFAEERAFTSCGPWAPHRMNDSAHLAAGNASATIRSLPHHHLTGDNDAVGPHTCGSTSSIADYRCSEHRLSCI